LSRRDGERLLLGKFADRRLRGIDRLIVGRHVDLRSDGQGVCGTIDRVGGEGAIRSGNRSPSVSPLQKDPAASMVVLRLPVRDDD
jgi:hypothetical protein